MSGDKIRTQVNYLEALKRLHTLENWNKFSILYLFLAVWGELNKLLKIYDVKTKWISSVKRRGRMLKGVQIWSGICVVPKKVSLKPRQILSGAWARREIPMSPSSKVFSEMDLC